MESSSSKWNDLLKFMVLVVILAGVVLVMLLARPLVFGQIVPAVVGDFLTPLPTATTAPLPTATITATEMPAATVPPPTAEPSPTPRLHTIQPGEHLTKIAETYGVTVEAILTLNGLTNPNQIIAGEQILIPPP
ncbi:MAG: hypothetical protein Fur0021_21240 [Candidatus Promineifilaceae bacterium]